MQSFFVCFETCLLKTHKKTTICLRVSERGYTQTITTTSKFTVYYQYFLPTHKVNGEGGQDRFGDGSQGKYR